MRPTRSVAVLLLLSLCAGPGAVFADGCPAVETLTWLDGRWLGELGDSRIEETWSAPAGGSILGTFRSIEPPAEGAAAGALRIGFYEFFVIEAGGTGPELRLLHFHPGLIGWEEKGDPLVFRCLAAAERSITFEVQKDDGPVRLTYRSPTADQLIAELQEKGNTLTFQYRRAP
jgi:hypothetical protein